MSDPRMAAARMTDRPQRYDEPTGGTPGVGLTGMDIAGALSMGGANRAEMLIVMYKWVQDKSAQQPLFYVVYDEVVKLATKYNWKPIKGKEIFRGLTMLAIAEVTDPHTCPTCQGRGERLTRNMMRQCPTCNGIGRQEMSDAMRYRALGIDRKAWERTWEPRYPRILAVVGGFEGRGLAAIRNGLREQE